MFKLFHVPGTRSSRILWLLGELGLPYELHAMSLPDVFSSKDYRAVASLGRVPALVREDGYVMVESLAIIEWLTETHDPEGRFWVRPGEAERGDYLQWLHLSETIAISLQNLNQQMNVIQPPEARSPVTVKLETRRLEKGMALVEKRLKGRRYLLNRGFTAVDIAMGWTVDSAFVFLPAEAVPACGAWLRRLRARPEGRRALIEGTGF